MAYDYNMKKTTIVISSTVEIGVAANVIGHLSLAIGHRFSVDDMGKSVLVDADGIPHKGISKYPIIITKVKPQRLKRFVHEARNSHDIVLVDYPKQMLNTSHDDELVAALSIVCESEIVYLGAAIHGDAETIKNLSGNFSLWKG